MWKADALGNSAHGDQILQYRREVSHTVCLSHTESEITCKTTNKIHIYN